MPAILVEGGFVTNEEELQELKNPTYLKRLAQGIANGIDEYFRREMKKVFPDKEFVELPPSHPIFHQKYDFNEGLPKVHEHDNKRPQAFGLFIDNRMVCLYTFEADLGDGWEDPSVHEDPENVRLSALKMGTNIVMWALSR